MDSIGEKSRSLNLFSLNVGALAQFLKSVRKEASQVVPVVNHTPANAGDVRDAGSIPGFGRSPGGGHGNPNQYSCLENPMDRGDWWAMVYKVPKSQTQLK